MTMIIATAHTGRFAFTTVAETVEEANSLLILAYAKHCRQYAKHCRQVGDPGYADPSLMTELINDDDVSYAEIAVGTVLRDGIPIITPTP